MTCSPPSRFEEVKDVEASVTMALYQSTDGPTAVSPGRAQHNNINGEKNNYITT